MTALSIKVATEDAAQLLEALDFIAGLCVAEPGPLDDALGRFVGTGYDAPRLRREIRELAVRLAKSMRCDDATSELAQ